MIRKLKAGQYRLYSRRKMPRPANVEISVPSRRDTRSSARESSSIFQASLNSDFSLGGAVRHAG
jgi:hypothetical protein